MNEILIGNGHFEDGLAFRFSEFMQDHKRVLSDIGDIKNGLKEVNANNNVLLGEITRVGAKVSGFEKQDERNQIAENLLNKKIQDKWQRVIWMIMAVLGLAGILLNNIKSISNSKKIENLGIPVIMNPRGGVIPIDAIPTDKFKDSLRDDSLMKIYKK
jgi:hypothetical protein